VIVKPLLTVRATAGLAALARDAHLNREPYPLTFRVAHGSASRQPAYDDYTLHDVMRQLHLVHELLASRENARRKLRGAQERYRHTYPQFDNGDYTDMREAAFQLARADIDLEAYLKEVM
jgi:hypothetical protein